MRRIVLGTRGSELARAQTSLVEAALHATHPNLEVAIEVIRTGGDEKGGENFQLAESEEVQVGNLHHGRKGLFTGEIERALVSRQIDVAIHSAKDLPSEATPGLEICAALPRAAVEDVLVMKAGAELAELRAGAVIATGSVRRQRQLRWVRPDIEIPDLRGNVPTRLRKLTVNSWEAIILARAGLERLGFDCSRGAIGFEGSSLIAAILPTDRFMPAGGQGIVALQIRSDDPETRLIIEVLSHAETLLCLRAEREFLRLLRGDCGTPVGVLATIESGEMTLRAQVFEDGQVAPKTAAIVRNPLTRRPELVAELLFNFLHASKS